MREDEVLHVDSAQDGGAAGMILIALHQPPPPLVQDLPVHPSRWVQRRPFIRGGVVAVLAVVAVARSIDQ